MATKQQILNWLDKKMKDMPMASSKYLAMGLGWIMVNKDLITPAEAQARFPELFP